MGERQTKWEEGKGRGRNLPCRTAGRLVTSVQPAYLPVGAAYAGKSGAEGGAGVEVCQAPGSVLPWNEGGSGKGWRRRGLGCGWEKVELRGGG